MKRNTIIAILSYLLSILFVYAAVVKAMDYKVFLADMAKSPLLVNYDKPTLSLIVLGIEFLTAALLLFKVTRKLGFYLASFVMLIFTLYLGTLYFFFTDVPCSCGGILGRMPYPVHIVFNLVFTAAAFSGTFLLSKPLRVATTAG